MYAVVVEKVKLTFVKIVLLKQRDPLLKLSICDAMLVILYYNIGELCLLTYKSNTKDNLEKWLQRQYIRGAGTVLLLNTLLIVWIDCVSIANVETIACIRSETHEVVWLDCLKVVCLRQNVDIFSRVDSLRIIWAWTEKQTWQINTKQRTCNKHPHSSLKFELYA